MKCRRTAGTKVPCSGFVSALQSGTTAWISALAFGSGLVNFLKLLLGFERCVFTGVSLEDPLLSELLPVTNLADLLCSRHPPSCWPPVFRILFVL